LSEWPCANIYEFSFDSATRDEQKISDSTTSLGRNLKFKSDSEMGRALLIAEYFIQTKSKTKKKIKIHKGRKTMVPPKTEKVQASPQKSLDGNIESRRETQNGSGRELMDFSTSDNEPQYEYIEEVAEADKLYPIYICTSHFESLDAP